VQRFLLAGLMKFVKEFLLRAERIARHLASLSFVVIGEGTKNFGLRIATQLIAAEKPLPQ
jgi:hypothetical protein